MKAKTEFEIGDEVIIRENLVGRNTYGCVFFNPAMEKFCGRKAIIVEKYSGSAPGSFCYFINIDGRTWFWSAAMFKPKKKQFNGLEAICLNL